CRNGSTSPALGDDDASRCGQGDFIVVLDTTEAILLPVAGDVAPDHTRSVGDRQAFQTRVVFVSNPRIVCLRENFLLNQIASAKDRILQRAGEHTKLDSRKADLEPRAIGANLATRRAIHSRRVLDFLGLPRQTGLISDAFGRRWISAAA